MGRGTPLSGEGVHVSRGGADGSVAAGSNGFFGLGAYQYYLGKRFAKLRVVLRFDPEVMALICLPEGCLRDLSAADSGDHES
jgi:hypothetical protein